MAKITVQIGAENIAIEPPNFNPKDLGQAATDLAFVLDGKLAAFLDQPLSSVKDGSLATLTLGPGTPTWNLAGGAATFSLQGNASASVKVQSTGPLFSYYVDFEQTTSEDVTGKTDAVYLITEFSFNISGGLSAKDPVGSIGVTAAAQGATSYTVRNYKAFDRTETLKNAILKALAAFTLPLHPGTVDNLQDGDAVYYTFDGSLNVGFGATYGISGSVGGYSLSEINSTFQKIGKVADVSASKTVTVAANAGLSLKFNWSRTFECFLECSRPVGGKASARLHLSAGKTSGRSLTLSADGGITAVTAPQLTVNTDTVTNWVVQKVAGGTAPAATSIFQTPLDQVKSEVQKYVDDANNWLSSLAQKIQGYGSISLALVFASSSQFTSAFTWNFDLANARFGEAWKDAVKGDFVAALATGAAALESGSGYESLHVRNTKLTLSLFGLAQFASLDTYFSKSTLRYGGNGTFYLETSAGQVSSSSSNSRSSSTSIYLDGTSESREGTGASVSNIRIQLHGILTTTGDKNQFAKLGNLTQALGMSLSGAAGASQLVSIGTVLKALARQSASPGSATVHVIYEFSALQRLQSDEYVNGNQPSPPHQLDAANWNAYEWASEKIPSEPESYLSIWLPTSPFYKTYTSWAAFNCLVNGFTDPDGNPLPQQKTDRHSFGNYQPAPLRQYFGTTLSDTTCDQLNFHFCAGQQFMNLCDDLHSLFAQINSGSMLDWDRITQRLEKIAGNDIDSWFGPATVLALADCVQASATIVQQGKVDPNASSVTAVVSIS
jgi:hypothetical protein